MRHLIPAVFILVFFAPAHAIQNPAVVYCEALGYQWEIQSTPAGQQTVVLVAPGVRFDAWDFYQGKVGQEYSYGALKGYQTRCEIIHKGSFTLEYAVCIPSMTDQLKGLSKITQLELMKQNGDWPSRPNPYLRNPASRLDPGPNPVLEKLRSIPPASFDWRNRGGNSYIGPIRDQGGCGACYSFGACAAGESAYNLFNNLTNNDCIDLSESFIIWCLGSIPPYSDHFYGCDGADYDYFELQALCNEGVCYESSFPYTGTDPGGCTHWADPRVKFNSWYRVDCQDITAMKNALMTYGALDAAVLTTTDFESYTSGIYEDSNTTCTADPCYNQESDHAIALVGWDDNPPEGGGGCWILRNSWGTSWGEGGYMRIRYTSAAVACSATYLVYNGTSQPSATPTSTSIVPVSSPSPTENEELTLTQTHIESDPTLTPTPDGVCVPPVSSPLICGVTHTGIFDSNDYDYFSDGTRVDYYTFSLLQTTTVTIRMFAADFYAYFLVYPNVDGCPTQLDILNAISDGPGTAAVGTEQLAAGDYYIMTNNYLVVDLPTSYSILIECEGQQVPTPTMDSLFTETPTPSLSFTVEPTLTSTEVSTYEMTPFPTPTADASPLFDPRADVNEDGKVDVEDLIILMENWKRSSQP